MRTAPCETLAGSLDLGRRELVALVGGGGKSGALLLLARELSSPDTRVVATTTTAMFSRELAAVGPVILGTVDQPLLDGLAMALAERGTVGVAASQGVEGKVVGLSPETVNALWKGETGIVPDYVIVEADGSRGRPLKAFGPGEPRTPSGTTIVVQVAGLDAISKPLDEDHVHRAELAAASLGVPLGSVVTAGLFAECLREQVRALALCCRSARIVTMLNKAEGPERGDLGLQVASYLLGPPKDRRIRSGAEAVVIASVRERRFVRVSREEEAGRAGRGRTTGDCWERRSRGEGRDAV